MFFGSRFVFFQCIFGLCLVGLHFFLSLIKVSYYPYTIDTSFPKQTYQELCKSQGWFHLGFSRPSCSTARCFQFVTCFCNSATHMASGESINIVDRYFCGRSMLRHLLVPLSAQTVKRHLRASYLM